MHGGGGDRTGAVAHAKLLVRHGYGVLLHDARGRGKSEGVQNAYGWGWPKDVAGAIGFLKARDEVDPERIGALGLSTGADILIQVAGQGTDLKAVVADGTYAGSFEDTRRIMGISAITPFMALEFATVGVTSGTTPGPAIEDMMKRITSPLLLVAAGPTRRMPASSTTARPATGRSTSGTCPTSATRPPSARSPPSTSERVTAFFDAALTGR